MEYNKNLELVKKFLLYFFVPIVAITVVTLLAWLCFQYFGAMATIITGSLIIWAIFAFGMANEEV